MITARITKRIAYHGRQTAYSGDPWGGLWGGSWGASWGTAATSVAALPAVDVLARVGRLPSISRTSRVTSHSYLMLDGDESGRLLLDDGSGFEIEGDITTILGAATKRVSD